MLSGIPQVGTSKTLGSFGAWLPNIIYEDMDIGTGGIARTTGVGNLATTVYSATGPGLLLGFLINLENIQEEWEVKLTIDGSIDIFNFKTDELTNPDIYGLGSETDEESSGGITPVAGLYITDNIFLWTGPQGHPLKYTSGVDISVKYTPGGTRQFRAGLVLRAV